MKKKKLESKGKVTVWSSVSLCVRVSIDSKEEGRRQREIEKVCRATRGKLQSVWLIS